MVLAERAGAELLDQALIRIAVPVTVSVCGSAAVRLDVVHREWLTTLDRTA
ncbi:hypothetical protein ACIOTI_42935 [Streptomyces sp. NPDC087843]|uniref:hypothetical protein n=1 Tax=Streptomyces sp. NPDC087843 TaxID=3365804 RepID=UPI00382AD1A8